MFHPRQRRIVLWLGCLAWAHAAQAQTTPGPPCRVPAFKAATSALGADAEMHVVNTGRPCVINTFGIPAERRNPAYEGTIVKAPQSGQAEFIAPRTVYTPNPGFEGEDYFEYTANARDMNGGALYFKVRVKVFVKAPG